MTEQKHTKGPWGIKPGRDYKNNVTVWDIKDNLHIAYVTNDGDRDYYIDDDIQQANARLIAASPGMLEALKLCEKALIDHLQYDGGESLERDAYNAASQAIAKAMGE